MHGSTSTWDLGMYVGGIVERAFQDADLGPKLAATGIVLAMPAYGRVPLAALPAG